MEILKTKNKYMKRAMSFVLSIVLVLTGVPLTSITASAAISGNGTYENPYIIDEASDFATMNGSDKYFKMTKNINMNSSDPGIETFSGYFEGGGYTITNLKGSLVNELEEGGTLANFTIDSPVAFDAENATYSVSRTFLPENVSSWWNDEDTPAEEGDVAYYYAFNFGYACGLNDGGTIDSVYVKNAEIKAYRSNNDKDFTDGVSYLSGNMGFVCGASGGGGVTQNCTVENCTIELGAASIGVGGIVGALDSQGGSSGGDVSTVKGSVVNGLTVKAGQVPLANTKLYCVGAIAGMMRELSWHTVSDAYVCNTTIQDQNGTTNTTNTLSMVGWVEKSTTFKNLKYTAGHNTFNSYGYDSNGTNSYEQNEKECGVASTTPITDYNDAYSGPDRATTSPYLPTFTSYYVPNSIELKFYDYNNTYLTKISGIFSLTNGAYTFNASENESFNYITDNRLYTNYIPGSYIIEPTDGSASTTVTDLSAVQSIKKSANIKQTSAIPILQYKAGTQYGSSYTPIWQIFGGTRWREYEQYTHGGGNTTRDNYVLFPKTGETFTTFQEHVSVKYQLSGTDEWTDAVTDGKYGVYTVKIDTSAVKDTFKDAVTNANETDTLWYLGPLTASQATISNPVNVYTGKAFKANVPALSNSKVKYTLVYKDEAGNESTDAPTEVGIYTVYAKDVGQYIAKTFADSWAATAEVKLGTFEIRYQASYDGEVTTKDNPVYGDKWSDIVSHNYTVSSNETPVSGDFTWQVKKSGTSAYTTISEDDILDAGTYDWKLLFTGGVYVDDEVAGATVTIDKRTVEFSWEDDSFVYEGTEKIPSVSITNKVSNDSIDLTVSGAQIDANTDETPSYAATITGITGSDASNYKLPTSGLTKEFTISNASQEKPNVTGKAESYKNAKDGTMEGLTTDMEISTSADSGYEKVSDVNMKFEADTYYVRVAAKKNYDASPYVTVEIQAGPMIQVTIPETQIGYTLTTEDYELEWGEGTTLTFSLAPGYSKIDGEFKVQATNADLVDNEDGTYTISNVRGNIEVSVKGVKDVTAPTGEISIKNSKWTSFWNAVTFGLFFKETTNVTVTAQDVDTGSGVAKVEYLIYEGESGFATEEAISGEWTTLEEKNGEYSFSIAPNKKFYVYVRITDGADNTTVMNSAGVVVYTDAVAGTETVTFTKLSGTDAKATVILNGNEIKDIYLGTDKIDTNNYEVSQDGTITLKADYLQSLAADNYTVQVEYNPMGETYVSGDDNTAPQTTSFELVIEKVTGIVSITNKDKLDRVYDSQTVDAEFERNNATGDVTIEYKEQGAADDTYTTTVPKNAGKYTVRVTIAADLSGNYTEAVSEPVDFEITKKDVTINGTAVKASRIYNGKTEAEITENGTLSANYDGDNLSFKVGTANYSDKNVGTKKTVSFTGFELIGSAKENYNLTGQPVSVKADITEKEITATFTVADKQYDGTIVGKITAQSLNNTVDKDDIYLDMSQAKAEFVIDLGEAQSEFENLNQGVTKDVTVSGYELAGKDKDNYKITSTTNVNASIYNKFTPENGKEYTATAMNDEGWINTDFVITAADGYEVSLTNSADNATWSPTLPKLEETEDGSITFYVRDTKNGAISVQVVEEYKIDKTPATGEVTFNDEETVWDKVLDIIAFDLYFKDTQMLNVTADDNLSDIAKVEYYEYVKPDMTGDESTSDEGQQPDEGQDGEQETTQALTLEEVQKLEDDVWTKMDGSVEVKREDAKRFVYYIRLTDKAGNISYLSTNGAEYDFTAPIVEGVKKDETYYTTQYVTISDKNLKSVMLNGEEIEDLTATLTLEGNKEVTYEIVATDLAGNVTTVKVTMKKVSAAAGQIENLTTENVKISDEQMIQDIEKQLEAIDTTNATDAEKEEIEKQIAKCDELLKKIEELKKEANSPNTGDASNIWMLFALMFVSGMGVFGITVYEKKRK